jgi:uncharacterized membrane protein
MMLILVIIVQWLHVFSGIFWFGGTLFLDFVVIPAVIGLPIAQQRSFSKRFSKIAARVVTPFAVLAILLGLVRGITFGPVKSLDFLFGTSYGITFLVGLVASVATFLWGLLVTSRQGERLNEIPVDEQAVAEGKLPVEFTKQLALVRQVAMLELLGFLAVFTCMILLRFGL